MPCEWYMCDYFWGDYMNKTKNLIFTSAIKVFSINGYDRATMDGIASEAGVAKGTLYYYFKSKEEIFKYIISEGMKVIQEEIDEAVSKTDGEIERLRTVFKTQLSLVNRNRDFFKVVASQLWGKEIRQFELRDIVNNYINYIESFISTSINAKMIKKGNSMLITYLFVGILSSCSIYEVSQNEENIDDIVDNVMNYILNGIGI